MDDDDDDDGDGAIATATCHRIAFALHLVVLLALLAAPRDNFLTTR